MARKLRHLLILLVGLLAAGGVRMMLDVPLAARLQADGLASPPMDDGTGARLGQTFYAVSLGGLRTLVATLCNIRALDAFENQDWDRLHKTYELMTTLAPRTGEYWTAGAHHQAMNAASYYRNDKYLNMPPLQREAKWRDSVRRGREFAERGIRHAPHSWQLQQLLGMLLTDKAKFHLFGKPDDYFTEAAHAFAAAADQPDAPTAMSHNELYALARAPSHRTEALALADKLYAIPANRSPMLRGVYFALHCSADPAADPETLALRVFGSPEAARKGLETYWKQRDALYPMNGVAEALVRLGGKAE